MDTIKSGVHPDWPIVPFRSIIVNGKAFYIHKFAWLTFHWAAVNKDNDRFGFSEISMDI